MWMYQIWFSHIFHRWGTGTHCAKIHSGNANSFQQKKKILKKIENTLVRPHITLIVAVFWKTGTKVVRDPLLKIKCNSPVFMERPFLKARSYTIVLSPLRMWRSFCQPDLWLADMVGWGPCPYVQKPRYIISLIYPYAIDNSSVGWACPHIFRCINNKC